MCRSNCVICLCPDKRAVLSEAYKVLKVKLFLLKASALFPRFVLFLVFILFLWVLQVGGELYLSDMYTSEVVPESFKLDPVFWGRL